MIPTFEERQQYLPIYVEEMGSINTFTHYWRFHTNIDLKDWKKSVSVINSTFNNLTTFCATLDNSNFKITKFSIGIFCNNASDDLKRIITIIEQHVNSLFTFGFHIKDEALLTRSHDQTTFIESSATNYAAKVNNHSLETNDRIITMQRLINGASSNVGIESAKIKSILQDVCCASTLLLIQFQQIIDLKMDNILPHKSLSNSLQQLHEQLSYNNEKLPFLIDNDTIRKFYNLVDIQCSFSEEKIFVQYLLPIMQEQKFTIYHMTPAPRLIENNIFELIIPDVEYVALDAEKQKYMSINENYLATCKISTSNSRICKLTQAIQYTHNSGACSVRILTAQELSTTCDYRIANLTHELWVQLQELNSWLFVFPINQKFTVTVQTKCIKH